MSDPAVECQIQIALRDDRKRDEFAEHIAELASQIANATFKFSQDIKSAYEIVPKRRLGDKNLDDIDQLRLTLGAFSFFMHVLDRYLLRMNTGVMREMILDFIFENLVQVYAKSFSRSAPQMEKLVLTHYDDRASELAEASTIFGEDREDRNTAVRRASRAICEEDLGRDDPRLLAIVDTHLVQALENLTLVDQIAAWQRCFVCQDNFQKPPRPIDKSGRAEVCRLRSSVQQARAACLATQQILQLDDVVCYAPR